VSLPAADDLFRPTTEPRSAEERPAAEPQAVPEAERPASGGEAGRGRQRTSRQPSGRVRHDEKMTVYVTADELLELEHARLLLRRDHDLGVDRGRIVRTAVALALADLDARGADSAIVQRLKQA
jgi:hypothetical protein